METLTKANVLGCDLALEGRQELEQGLAFAVQNHELLTDLVAEVQEAIAIKAREYLDVGNFILFKKMFKDALPYITERRIRRLDVGMFIVEGLTDNHYITTADSGELVCDCDLFNGRGKFVGLSGDCSHIQAADLLELADSLDERPSV